MAKRMQEQKEEERIVAKSRPTALNLSSTVPASSSSANSPIASRIPGTIKASSRQIVSSGRLGERSSENSNPDAASSSQGRQRDAPLDISTGEPVGTCTIWTRRISRKPLKLQKIQKIRNPIVRQTYGRKPTDDLKDLDVNTALWKTLMSVTLQAAVHLVQDYLENLRSIKNQPLMSVKQSIRTTEKLITDQKEITCIPVIDWNQPMWCATTLLSDRAVQFTKSQTYVFADSVLCLEGKSTEQVGICRHAIPKIWIESTGKRWNSSGKIPMIHYIDISR